jgi:tRNA U34 5-methylaminomethyl-2-thiouridine-forming methyltransferase MnmC
MRYFLEKSGNKRVKILEVGFGTGLNFLITADFCSENNIQLDYTGIEAHPLEPEMIGIPDTRNISLLTYGIHSQRNTRKHKSLWYRLANHVH